MALSPDPPEPTQRPGVGTVSASALRAVLQRRLAGWPEAGQDPAPAPSDAVAARRDAIIAWILASDDNAAAFAASPRQALVDAGLLTPSSISRVRR